MATIPNVNIAGSQNVRSIDSYFLFAKGQRLSTSQLFRDPNVGDRDQKDRNHYPDEKHVEHGSSLEKHGSIKRASECSMRMLIILSGVDRRGFQNDMRHCETKAGRRCRGNAREPAGLIAGPRLFN